MPNRQASRLEIVSLTMKHYAIVIEKAASNYSAYVPDLPGCIATGSTPEEAERLLREAIELHLDGMREDGEPIPEPTSRVEYVEVDA
jgi:predicted RNase H-like HicB family nuclease